MELLATLDLAHTNAFFSTFFRLPDFYWRGFLSSELSSGQLIVFALLTYAMAPLSIKWSLMRHLVNSPAGGYLVRAYLGTVKCPIREPPISEVSRSAKGFSHDGLSGYCTIGFRSANVSAKRRAIWATVHVR
jgi:hypothetical protein